MMNNRKGIAQAAAGVAVLLFAGMVYAWSVLSGPIAAEYADWTKAQLSLTFTIVMILFCVGCMVGGFLNGKVRPRICLWISAVLFIAGFFLSAGMHTRMMLYLGFGVICGFASGFAYNAVMGTVSKWFPDCQGLISGVLLMGFGLSSFIVGKLYQAFTPAAVGAWRGSFRVLGVITAVVVLLCGFVIRPPKSGECVDAASRGTSGKASHKTARKYVNQVAMDTPTGLMLRRPSFWLYYLWAILVSAAGLALVSHASGVAREAADGLSPGTIATVVGMISIFNGIGRVIFGGMFDRLGRSIVMQSVNVLYIITTVILMAALKQHSFALITAGFIIGGLSYGGVTPTNSAFVSSYFGMKHYPMNFSVINTNLILASFGSTIAGTLFDLSKTYMSTCLMMCVLALLGIFVSAGINITDRKLEKEMWKSR